MRIKKFLGAALAAAALSAATIGFTGGPANAMPTIDNENSTYFSLRHDLRRCASPFCGGFFVKRVNYDLTRCADGTQQPECYVAELDLDALGLDADQAGQVSGTPEQFLLRGDVLPNVVPGFGNLGTFRASEAWRGHAGVTPAGGFFRARNNGILCITFPCLSFTAATLNTPVTEDVAGVALDGIVADPSDGLAQLNEPEGLLLAAKRVIVTGPAGDAPALEASEFYLPFEPAAQPCGSRGLPAVRHRRVLRLPAGRDVRPRRRARRVRRAAGCGSVHRRIRSRVRLRRRHLRQRVSSPCRRRERRVRRPVRADHQPLRDHSLRVRDPLRGARGGLRARAVPVDRRVRPRRVPGSLRRRRRHSLPRHGPLRRRSDR